ncbi:TSUP family transporter [Roseobacter sp. HKCCD9010]|uniref:sulfite exporter TauE/SafE family protein n=1 Tax=unclassified Roseobacter TaxID=196798 RepID=UPI001492C4F1|nr:TSUP family transporter [Rhodobacterales bacterium HKCCD4356]NNV13981.1 TSUP family transporter [Roseobacter sp. HKCCD7357]NNV18222.1 TSUP family transporter [Roseobacter sp. HKCCD8768]NNV27682.1 TSUP family transporter [Roseobacter sp. HKCCD8192]NNV31994.1 TSUP family transporter [Roseobacter sp. HKCCD9061]NNV36176.1 TSUP family transporter [Roseobacter sp. HKCCD9073]NNV40508.1 TSUP family transporter [Roseobacter sp. HKCCD9054]NNV44694.1 TSUP family transporter [Roseobacter sp. HKCCD649
MAEVAVIIVAGFLCGALNAIAGGGTFVTLPVLIWIGIPPIVANATATTMAVPGYIASAWAYRHDIRAEGALRLGTIIMIAAIGGVLGAALLIITSPDAFLALIPWLLLVATLLFAFAPQVQKLSEDGNIGLHTKTTAIIIVLLVTTYGGYFNGGLGIIMLAALALQGYRDIHGMNGVKNLLASILSILSVVTFMTADLIAWDAAISMAVANICGAYATSKLVRRMTRTDVLRGVIIAIGASMTLVFFVV